jgi:hypothetical protein
MAAGPGSALAYDLPGSPFANFVPRGTKADKRVSVRIFETTHAPGRQFLIWLGALDKISQISA